MNIAELSIRRPVMTTLVMASILIAGIFGYRLLPVAELPTVDFPTITVSATLPGASPDTMAAAVATPLEAQFTTIPGLDSMTSVSAQGSTQITLQFALDRNIDAAAQDVQTAISAAQRKLPAEMTSPPSFRKINPGDTPVLYISMTSDTLPLSTVNEYAETQLAQRLSTISGVAQVQVYGSRKFAVRVQVDPAKLAQYGIAINDVAGAIAAGNSNSPTGQIDTASQSFAVRVNGQLDTARDYENLIIASRNGTPLRVSDVGRAVDSVENQRIGAWFNGKPGVILAVQRQPGANTIATVDAVKATLPQFAATLPAGVKMTLLYDRSESIRASVHDVQITLVSAAVLVVLVIFLFLKNLRATLIPALALPIAVVGTFAVMAFFDYSLDNLSLLALTLAVGYVVDDAVVMLENIYRHLEMGKRPFDAALDGAREVGFTIVSMTLSLVAVFIPLLFMPGILGRLFHEFAVTICAAILVSGLVSLTLTPMLAGRALKRLGADQAGQHGHDDGPRWLAWFERALDATRRGYARTLRWTVNHVWLMFGVFLATLVGTVALFMAVPKAFIPTADSGQLIATLEGPIDASFDYMASHRGQIEEIVRANPNVELFNLVAGAVGGRGASNGGLVFIKLKPRNERPLGADAAAAQLRRQLAAVPGLRIYVQNPPSIRIGGAVTQAQYQYVLQGQDLPQLYAWTDRLLERIRALPGFADVNSNLNLNSPALQVTLDRNKLESMGLTAQQAEQALEAAFGSRQVSTIYGTAAQYQVILEALPQYQQDPNAIAAIQLRTPQGKLVPLESVATLTRTTQALTINHLGQLPATTISFNLSPGTTIGQAVDALHRLEREMRLPASVSASLQGEAQAFAASQSGQLALLAVAVLVVYVILGVLYESFVHPLTILSGLPTAGVGALLALLVTGLPLGIYGFVGLILLIGIVKKNAIMMIDFALEAQRGRGLTPHDAIIEAAGVRFRPIMMTTLAALAGTLPIALGLGAGGDVRQPLGVAVVGGLLVSQVLTLYITPVIYLLLARLEKQPQRAPDTTRRGPTPQPAGAE